MADPRIIDVSLDERTVLKRNADIEQERKVALFDLLHENHFKPARVPADGYAGTLGSASAAVMGDFVVVDMFAEACTGNKTPRQAATDAAERVKRYYKT